MNTRDDKILENHITEFTIREVFVQVLLPFGWLYKIYLRHDQNLDIEPPNIVDI